MFRDPSWIRRGGVALLLLVSLGLGTFAPPHESDGDLACNPIPVTHDESAHYIGADATPAPAEAGHCFLCHSLRSFYPAFEKFEQHHYGRRAERLHAAPINRDRLVAWTLVPGRAPPA